MNIATNFKTIIAAAAIGVVALFGGAQAATIPCVAAVSAALSTNIGCEVSTNADQDSIGGPLGTIITVNSEEFFGTDDWTYVGKNNVGGSSEGANPPTLAGLDVGQDGTMGISASLWSTSGEVMAIFKSGSGTFITGFLLKTGDTSFGYSSPFFVAGKDDKDISHVTLYARGAPVSVVPLPAAGWMLIAGLGGLAAMRRRRKA
jgi:hypothetical protein